MVHLFGDKNVVKLNSLLKISHKLFRNACLFIMSMHMLIQPPLLALEGSETQPVH